MSALVSKEKEYGMYDTMPLLKQHTTQNKLSTEGWFSQAWKRGFLLAEESYIL